MDYRDLYAPYTGDGATIERSLMWLSKITQAPEDLISKVMVDTFVELAAGKSFVGLCKCGCTLKNSHTKIEHYMRQKVRDQISEQFKLRVESTLPKALEKAIKVYEKSLIPKKDHIVKRFLHGFFFPKLTEQELKQYINSCGYY